MFVNRFFTLLLFLVVVEFSSSEVRAEFQFSEPTRLGDEVNVVVSWEQSVASNDLSLFFSSSRDGGVGDWDVWVATRDIENAPWGNVQNLTDVVNSGALDGSPDISTDGRTLFFNSDRAGGEGDRDIWFTSRPTTESPWSPAMNAGPGINSNSFEGWPTISSDGRSLYYTTDREVDGELVVSRRNSTDDPWGEPESLGVIGGTPDISSDGLSLFFASSSPQGEIQSIGGIDIWVMTRDDIHSDFGAPQLLPETINTSGDDFSPNLSEDGSTFTFYSRGSIWEAAVVPEPSSFGLVSIGTIFIFNLFRRYR